MIWTIYFSLQARGVSSTTTHIGSSDTSCLLRMQLYENEGFRWGIRHSTRIRIITLSPMRIGRTSYTLEIKDVRKRSAVQIKKKSNQRVVNEASDSDGTLTVLCKNNTSRTRNKSVGKVRSHKHGVIKWYFNLYRYKSLGFWSTSIRLT